MVVHVAHKFHGLVDSSDAWDTNLSPAAVVPSDVQQYAHLSHWQLPQNGWRNAQPNHHGMEYFRDDVSHFGTVSAGPRPL
jgi:hypothetical protein